VCPSAPRTTPTLHSVPTVPTVGVEEEFFLLRPDGSAAAVAPQVLGDLPASPRFQAEGMQFQIEAATGVCTDLMALADEMAEGRRAVARAAAGHGAELVSSGTAPMRAGGAVPTDDDRYHHLRASFPGVVDVVSCGCHVHVGVPSRAAGVETLNRVRGWLPVLLALSANSPMWEGGDSGWESYRHEVFRRWPTAQVAPSCDDEAAYDTAVAARIADLHAIDARSVYWYARLSPRFPTVEFRIADTGLTVADTLLQAALCRALVAMCLAEALDARPVVAVPDRLLEESLVGAARYGLGTLLVDPLTGALAPGLTVLQKLVEHVRPALHASGDWETVARLVVQRRARRSGSSRQRALRTDRDHLQFVAGLAALSLSDDHTQAAGAAVPRVPRVPGEPGGPAEPLRVSARTEEEER
jgi:glutamate---cysteine ligase / carboxylate-amine ligase